MITVKFGKLIGENPSLKSQNPVSEGEARKKGSPTTVK